MRGGCVSNAEKSRRNLWQWCSQILPDTAEALGMSYYAVCRALGMLLDEIRGIDGGAAAKRKIGLPKNDPLTDRKDFVYRVAMLVKGKI